MLTSDDGGASPGRGVGAAIACHQPAADMGPARVTSVVPVAVTQLEDDAGSSQLERITTGGVRVPASVPLAAMSGIALHQKNPHNPPL